MLQIIRALAHVRRAEDEPEVEDAIASYVDETTDRWEALWPTARAALVSKAVDGDVDAGVAAAAAVYDDWITAAHELLLIDSLAEAYAIGHSAALESAREVARSPRLRIARPTTRSEEDAIDAFSTKIATEFTVADERAAAWLRRDTMFWVGNAWDHKLGGMIAREARRLVGIGGSRKELGDRLRQKLDQRFARPQAYWELVGAAASVRARSYGAVSGMESAGVKTFRFRAIMDERTSPICREMNNRTWTIETARQHVDDMIATQSPEDVKDVAPWVAPSEVQGASDADLASLGVLLPPLHGRCRSFIVSEGF